MVVVVEIEVVESLLEESRIVPEKSQPQSIDIIVVLQCSVVQIVPHHDQCPL